MPHLKIVREYYETYEDTEVAIHKYINRHAVNHCYGGLAVDPEHAAEQMELYRNYYGKNTRYCLLHWILSFSVNESLQCSEETLMAAAYSICEYYSQEYQIIFGVHWANHMWDIHFAMNPVNYRTGLKFAMNYKAQDTLKKICETEFPGMKVFLDIY